jgi:hypothetical protein
LFDVPVQPICKKDVHVVDKSTIEQIGFVIHVYRNTIAGSPPGERIFIFFEKIRFASQKLNFSILSFSKKISKNDFK